MKRGLGEHGSLGTSETEVEEKNITEGRGEHRVLDVFGSRGRDFFFLPASRNPGVKTE